MTLTLRLALRNLVRNRRRSVLAGSFIALSLVALILADGFMRGVMEDMVRRATDDFAGHAQIHADGYLEQPSLQSTLPQLATLRQTVSAQQAVLSHAPRTLSLAQLSSADNTMNVQLIGVDPEAERSVSRLHEVLLGAGDPSRFADGDDQSILLGSALAHRLGIKTGDTVSVTVATADNGTLAQQQFRVAALFEFGQVALNESTAVITLQASQQLLRLGDQAHQLVLRLKQPMLARDAESPLWKELTQALSQDLASDNLDIRSWTQLMPDLASMLPMVEMSLYAMGGLLFFLAGLGVLNTFFMSIHERTYEFGVLRSIGTRAGAVGRLILTEAGVLGLLSVLVGLVIGGGLLAYLANAGVEYGANLQVSGITLQSTIYPQISQSQFSWIPLSVLALTLVACLYPAWHAARIVPAQAMQQR